MTVVEWLMDSDPSIRWQVMRYLTDAPDDLVAAERSRVATEGWGAGLLSLQTRDGHWGGDLSNPEWHCFLALVQLRELGLGPQSIEARHSVGLIRDNVTWHWWGPSAFFDGEVEPCINGRIVAVGAYFGQDVEKLVDRLFGEQMDDGGWNCEQENGATVGSFHTTINVLEGLLEHERATGGTDKTRTARLRGEEYLLKRRLLRRLSTGEIIDQAFTQFTYPWGYHYDVLRALDYLRGTGAIPDARALEAIELVQQKRDEDGRWLLENPHPEWSWYERWPVPLTLELQMDEAEGKPSRWNTLHAMRVLRWSDRTEDSGNRG